MIVVGTYAFILEKRKQLLFVTPQTFFDSIDFLVLRILLHQLIEPFVKLGQTSLKNVRLKSIALFVQTYRIPRQAAKLFSKSLSFYGFFAFVGFDQCREQMVETFLFCQSLDHIVGAPEIRNQNAFKQYANDFDDDGRPPAFVNDVITQCFGCKAP